MQWFQLKTRIIVVTKDIEKYSLNESGLNSADAKPELAHRFGKPAGNNLTKNSICGTCCV